MCAQVGQSDDVKPGHRRVELPAWSPGLGRCHEVRGRRRADHGGPVRREQVRLQAAEMFEHGEDARQVASSLRVSAKSATSGGAPGKADGEAALASKGSLGRGAVMAGADTV